MRKTLAIVLTLLLCLASALAREEGVTLVFSFVGDCTLGGEAGGSSEKYFAKVCDEKGYGYFFGSVKELFDRDDFTVVNLEGPLTECNTKGEKAQYYFRGRPDYARILTEGGVEVANLANNHIFNFGQQGFDDTVSALDAEGIGSCGYDRIYYAEKKGVRVAFVGFDQWKSTDDDIKRVVTEARANSDILIVSYHGGVENTHAIGDRVMQAGKLCIDLGADIVVGNHSHVYSGIVKHKGKYLIGSLGNFCFGGNLNKPYDCRCTIFRQAFTVYPSGKVEDAGIDIIPSYMGSKKDINDLRPGPIQGGFAPESAFNSIMNRSGFKARDVKWLADSFAVSRGLDKK
ncbi:MAG: CapA family protein [Clostridia bacterium]|nr:CapA family protein [Clostridia bacterium]